MHWDEEFDVVCVGSGVGGLTGAAAAADRGARVLLIEKDSQVGGVTARSGGQFWIGASTPEGELGIDDSIAETRDYLDALGKGLAVPALRDVYLAVGVEVMDYLRTVLEVPLFVIRGLPDYYFPILPGSKPEGRYLEVEPFPSDLLGEWAAQSVVSPYDPIFTYVTFQEILAAKQGSGEPLDQLIARRLEVDERCAGAGLTGWLLKSALDRAVTVRVSCRAVRLLREDGRVVGLVAASPDGETTIRATRGVLLATSGYDWNAELMRDNEGLRESASMSPATVEGDHLGMASEIGAVSVAARTPADTPIFIGYGIPGRSVDGHLMHRNVSPGHPHSMIVNRAGRRFADDAFYPDVVAKVTGEPGSENPNWPAWWVFDQNFMDRNGVPPIRPGEPLPDGLATSGATVREMASATGIDPTGLEETVARFNAFCASGVDEDFGRGSRPWSNTMIGDPRITPNPNLAPIERGPYYAIELTRVAMGVPTAGLAINEVSQVLDVDGAPIEGLYAAGNATAWRDIGGGYNSGIANSRGAIAGFLAAKSMTSS